MANLVVTADEVDDITGCVGEYADCAALYEGSQRVVDIHLSLWDGKHHVDPLLGYLLWQLAYRRVILQVQATVGTVQLKYIRY